MKAIFLTVLATALLPAQSAPTNCAVVSPAAAKLEFDAASVKPAGPRPPGPMMTGISGGPGTNDPGRATTARVPLAALIYTAYALMVDQVSGPDWIRDATNNGYAISATMPDTTTREEYCGMLRNMLASRFHLTFHRETQPRSAYELTVMPGGAKFKKYDPDAGGPEPGSEFRSDQNGFPVLSPRSQTAVAISVGANGLTKLSFRNNIDLFAHMLGSDINPSSGIRTAGDPVPRVVDKTGLTGIYDIHIEFAGGPMRMAAPPPDIIGTTPAAPDPSDVGPNIFNAVQQQLGLKLTKVKDVPVEVLIVEHADPIPTDN
jgi:uncharacterized protein (TIGR03435 family)